jgi:hypothetical protein
MTLETVESGWIGKLDHVDRSGRNEPSCGRGALAAIVGPRTIPRMPLVGTVTTTRA